MVAAAYEFQPCDESTHTSKILVLWIPRGRFSSELSKSRRLLHSLKVIKHTTDKGSRTHSVRIFVFGAELNEDTPVQKSSMGERHSKKLNQIKP